jgi:hypothetical protein
MNETNDSRLRKTEARNQGELPTRWNWKWSARPLSHARVVDAYVMCLLLTCGWHVLDPVHPMCRAEGSKRKRITKSSTYGVEWKVPKETKKKGESSSYGGRGAKATGKLGLSSHEKKSATFAFAANKTNLSVLGFRDWDGKDATTSVESN